MCPRNCSSGYCCATSSSDETGVLSVIAAFCRGVWWLVRYIAYPLVKYVLAPATVFVLVMGWRWLSGAALTGKARPATFTRGAVPPARPARRFAARINWAYWPGWQRAIMRWVLTALVVAGLMWPVATIAAVVSVVLAAVAMRYRFAIATRVRSLRPRPAVVRVTAQVAPSQPRALSASSGDPVWSATTSAATTHGGIR
jgi:hypothetical protein